MTSVANTEARLRRAECGLVEAYSTPRWRLIRRSRAINAAEEEYWFALKAYLAVHGLRSTVYGLRSTVYGRIRHEHHKD